MICSAFDLRDESLISPDKQRSIRPSRRFLPRGSKQDRESAQLTRGFEARDERLAGAALKDTVMTVNRDSDSLQEGDERQAVKRSLDSATLQLAAEELSVSKETVETGRVRVATRTREREALIDENLAHERVEIETVPMGLRIDAVPKARQEGDTTIIPIVEEILVVERRLVLKEEVRIRRVRTTERHTETVMLRYQEAVVTRHPGETGETDIGSVSASGQTNPERE